MKMALSLNKKMGVQLKLLDIILIRLIKIIYFSSLCQLSSFYSHSFHSIFLHSFLFFLLLPTVFSVCAILTATIFTTYQPIHKAVTISFQASTLFTFTSFVPFTAIECCRLFLFDCLYHLTPLISTLCIFTSPASTSITLPPILKTLAVHF